MGVRRQAREAALQMLFMSDALGEWKVSQAELCFEHFEIPQTILPYAKILVTGVINNLAEIDAQLATASEHWSLSRMSRVDRSILRIAAFEILSLDDIPPNVAIDEAIEISKRYGTDNSSVFVNGVLDRVASSLRRKIEVSVQANASTEPAIPEIDLPKPNIPNINKIN